MLLSTISLNYKYYGDFIILVKLIKLVLIVGLLQFGIYFKISMLGLRRNKKVDIISTQQCKELMSKQFNQLLNEHIINQAQEQLVQHCSRAMNVDLKKEQHIKNQLNNKFFNTPKNRKKKKYYLQSKLSLTNSVDADFKKRLSKEIKNSISVGRVSRSTYVSTPQPKSTRYGSPDFVKEPSICAFSRFKNETPGRIQRENSTKRQRNSLFSIQLNNIIEQSHKMKNKSPLKRDIMTATDRKKHHQRQFKAQRMEIIDKIIENDVDIYIRTLSQSGKMSSDQFKNWQQERRRQELSNLQKYNMSFTNYMRQKTFNNIEKTIYEEKIRQKQTYVEKFQNHILSEFKFSNEARRRLQKLFKNIQLEYKRPMRNRQFSERVSKK